MCICFIYTNFANQWVTTYTHSLKEHKKERYLSVITVRTLSSQGYDCLSFL